MGLDQALLWSRRSFTTGFIPSAHKGLLLAGCWEHPGCLHPPCTLQYQALPPLVPLPDAMQFLFFFPPLPFHR